MTCALSSNFSWVPSGTYLNDKFKRQTQKESGRQAESRSTRDLPLLLPTTQGGEMKDENEGQG